MSVPRLSISEVYKLSLAAKENSPKKEVNPRDWNQHRSPQPIKKGVTKLDIVMLAAFIGASCGGIFYCLSLTSITRMEFLIGCVVVSLCFKK